MLRERIVALTLGLALSAPFALAPAPPAQADDIDIYTGAGGGDAGIPLVVLNLDLNLDPTEIVCSNVLADPETLVGEPACELLQRVAVLPVLEESLGLPLGSLVGTLTSATGGILGVVGNLTGVTLGGLADTLRGIIGEEGSGTEVALDQLDVARLLVYRLVHQLVGVRLAVLASHADTCAPGDFAHHRRTTNGCSNGALVLLDATELLEDNLDTTVDTVLARIGDTADDLDGGDRGPFQITICHKPDGPNPQTKHVNLSALGGHLRHGDHLGACAAPSREPHPFQGKEVYYELVRYLRGDTVFNADIDDDDSLPLTADPAATQGNSYDSPLDARTCDEVHVINVLLTDPQAQDESDGAILADGALSGVDLDGNGELTFPEMTDYLAEDGFAHGGGRYTMRSYYLINGIDGGGVTSLLSNLVGTVMNLPIALNPLAIDYVRPESFGAGLATSATFGGPQTVYNRRNLGDPRAELYTGMFRPDPERRPAWRGNLKKLQVSGSGADTRIVDALGNAAVGNDGAIDDDALTFWTDPDGLPSEAGVPDGRDGGIADRGGAGMFLMPPYTATSPRNPAAARGSGGAGPRVYYQSGGGSAGALPVASLNIDSATVTDARPAMEADDDLEAAKLIAWARGYETDPDELGEEGYGGLLGFLNDLVSGLTDLIEDLLEATLRGVFCNPVFGGLFGQLLGYDCNVPSAEEPPAKPWVMGNVLHSDPLAIDYGTARNSDIRVFVGTNAGFLHQFRDSPDGQGTFAGQEVWRFSPRAVMDHYRTWRTNSPTASSRPYGVDGAPVAHIRDTDGIINAADGDKVRLYFGLRRGGKGYYALDVTSPDSAPTGLWRIEKTDGGDFDELGLTFSTPRTGSVGLATGGGDAERTPVLVFGGGYDGGYTEGGTPLGKDAASGSDFDTGKSANAAANRNLVGDDDDEGNALYVVEAETGELIWKAGKGNRAGAGRAGGTDVWTHPDLDDGIASAPTALDTDGDGLLDRIYVGDTGGRVWRADIGDPDPGNWEMAPIADLGRHAAGNATVADDRRFFHAPDVVRVDAGELGFYAVIIASGNRADPYNRHTENHLYVLKDGDALDIDADPIEPDDLADFDANCTGGGDCASLLDADFTDMGWSMRLPGSGEKALSAPTTMTGTILFTSYLPPAVDAAACTPQEGTGRLYAVDLRTAEPALDDFAADGESAPGGSFYGARGTPMTAAGIPGDVRYLAPGVFLGSDYSLTQVDHRQIWRTYWRDRTGEP
ncbi:hypothetical protein PC39_08474 [Salinisphaera sp. PC39]|uniref:pilus assembly protein n=1 Tax=Salinisphaera sp. PC39 TaxID=1304156 RepID=UPI003341DFCA